MPQISVIIPVYNHMAALDRSLATLFAQTLIPYEIIIVNDGSTDGVESTIKTWQEKRPDMRWIVLEQAHTGASGARNAGLLAATGDLVIFWDADTVAKPEMLGRMYQALIDNPKVSYAYSHYRFGRKLMRSRPFDATRLKENNFIDTTSLVWKKDAEPFDENLRRFQDWDVWLTLLEKNKTGVLVPEVLFSKLVGSRIGYSKWIPKFYFKLPWRPAAVKQYLEAKAIVAKKHNLTASQNS